MDLIEMRKSVWQLGENDFCIAAVHRVHVVPFKRIHEAFRHPVGLRAAHRRMDRLEPHRARQGMRFMGAVSAAVVTQELQFGRFNAGLAEPCLNCFDHHHVAHRLTRQAARGPGAPCNDLVVTAVSSGCKLIHAAIEN